MMRNIFLTGGTGLIGEKLLIKKLSNDGHNFKKFRRGKLDIGKEVISEVKN